MATTLQPSGENGNVLHRISARLPYLAPALRQIAEFLLNEPDRAQHMTIVELAEAARVAESTVSRFVRLLGLDGYQSLRLAVAEATFLSRTEPAAEQHPFVYEGISEGDSGSTIVGKIERSAGQALRHTAERLDEKAVGRAVDLIERSSCLSFACMGLSSIAAEDGVMRFTRAGRRCMLFRDQSIQVMSATILGPADVIIGISDSGESAPVVDALRLGRERGAGTIVITSCEGSSVTKHAEVTLFTSNVPTGGLLYGEAVTSKWGQLLVIDILYACFAARHYDETLRHLKETYAAGIKQTRAPAN